MGWFTVVGNLISDDELAVDRRNPLHHLIFQLHVCLSLFVSQEIMEIT